MSRPIRAAIEQLWKAVGPGDAGGLTDADLLRRWLPGALRPVSARRRARKVSPASPGASPGRSGAPSPPAGAPEFAASGRAKPRKE